MAVTDNRKIGVVCPYRHAYLVWLRENNKDPRDHVRIHDHAEESLCGLELSEIINGPAGERVNDEIVEIAKTRIR
jgi:hypothetical protein